MLSFIRHATNSDDMKGLTRRAKAAKPIIVGIDDPSTIIEAEHATLPPVDEPAKFSAILESYVGVFFYMRK
jgi:hypothetical protein